MPKYQVVFEIAFEIEAEERDEALEIAYSKSRNEVVSDIFVDIKEIK